jgi:hypothetical protein
MSAAASAAQTRSGSYVFPDGSSLVRARYLAWTPWAVAGMNFKLLDVDRSFDKSTFLLNAVEGALIPAFKQSGALELFVEAGQMSFGRGSLGAGDYVYLPGGGRNGPLELAPGTQVYAIAHGPLRMGDTFIDADWMIDAIGNSPAGDHIKAVLQGA